MWQIVLAVGGVVAAAVIKYVMTDDEVSGERPVTTTKNIGPIALWGVPNSGKSTFVKRLLGEAPDEIKVQTSHIKRHLNLEFNSAGINYKIEKIYDMPGVDSRKSEWLSHVKDSETSIYLINLKQYFEKGGAYQKVVKQHLKELKTALVENEAINLIVIGTHLDESAFCGSNEPDNAIQQTEEFEVVMASLQGLTIWFYSVNLLDDSSCRRLIENIVGDINARA